MAETDLRAHVPDAVLRSDPQLARDSDDRSRQYFRRGPRELDRRGRPCRLVRDRVTATRESIVDVAGSRAAAVQAAVVAASVSFRQGTARAQHAACGCAGGCRMSTLVGEHAVVTGASRGIGAAIARVLAQAGIRVSMLGRSLES